MSVTFYPARLDGNCYVWVGDSETFLNFSNTTARQLVHGIGVIEYWNDESGLLDVVPIECFEARCTAFLRNHLGKPDPAIPTIVSQQPGRATLTECGRPEGWLQERVLELLRSIKDGRARGATHVYAG